MFTRLGLVIGRLRWAVVVLAAAFIGVSAWYGGGLFNVVDTSVASFANKTSESFQAREEAARYFSHSGADVLVVLSSKQDTSVMVPEAEAEMAHIAEAIRSTDVQIASYASTGSDAFISKDQRHAFLAIATPSRDQAEEIIYKMRAVESSIFTIRVGGETAINLDVSHQVEEDLKVAELVSFSLLAVLLIVVFRSVVAGVLPLVLGGFTILGAFFVTRLLTEVMDISEYAVNVIILIGLGLAIDYSLFIVSRFREELREGQTVPDALTRTVATAGRTVFFSGLTVIISLLGLFVFPLGFLQSMSLGGAAAVVVAMVAALVVLPAILAILGYKVNALSFGKVQREHRALQNGDAVAEKQSFWYHTGRFFMRWPWPAVAVSFGLLIIMGLPFAHAHFSSADYRTLPVTSEAREASELLVNEFGDQPDPIQIVYRADGDVTLPEQTGRLYDYTQELQKLGGVTKVTSLSTQLNLSREEHQQVYQDPTANPAIPQMVERLANYDRALIEVHYTGAADSSTAQTLVQHIRQLSPPENATVLVGGEPAALYDLLQTIVEYIPWGLSIIIGALFILLFLMLGSIIIPLKAMLMNLLSLSAAFGAMVWVFQDGNLTSLLNFSHTGSLDATMPILIFAIAFGLSMDYAVFLYSRIKEQYDQTGSNEEAVLLGLQKTGSIITSAAVLLFVAVAAFGTARIPLMQQIALGLSLTVLVDAFLVRMVLVPALMKPLGRWNWWAPAPLKRLQRRLGLGE